METKEVEKEVAELESGKNNKHKKKNGALKYALNISFVLIATGLSIFISIKDDAKDIWSRIANPNNPHALWWLAVLGGVCFMILMRSFILFCFARLYSKDYKFHQAIAVDQIGQFYNAVTPGASGGQIMQAYTYKKQGIPVSSAVSILAMYSIVFQSILILYGLASFIVKYDFITALGSINTGIKINEVSIDIPIWPLTILGFLLNASIILIVLLMGYWHSFHNFIMGPVIGFFAKIKLIKNPEKTRENLRIQVENFKIEFRRLLTNVRFTILVVICFVIYMGVRFSIPYFVGLALGNQSTVATFWDCIFLSNYHQMVTGLIPVPGSAGVSELFFYQIFVNTSNPEAGFFYLPATDTLSAVAASENLCKSALIIWRFATFTLPVLAAGLVAAFYRTSNKKEMEASKSDMPSRQTFISLQNETYSQRKIEVDTIVETRVLSRKDIAKRMKALQRLKTDEPDENEEEEFDSLDIKDEE